jgi:hypothetical protein
VVAAGARSIGGLVSELFAIEDMDNLRVILMHHLGDPRLIDDHGKPLGALDQRGYEALERDLLRYCTRLRCQPRTDEHVDEQGYPVPAHMLIAGGR